MYTQDQTTSRQYVTLAEAANLLGVSKATLRNWDNNGKLTAMRHPINGYRLFDLTELRQLQTQLGLFFEEIEALPPDSLDLRGVRRLIARLHDTLRDTDSQSNIITRFDELTKLLFAKVMADRAPSTEATATFGQSSGPVNPKAVRDYYQSLAVQFSELIPPHFRTLNCSDRAISECISALRIFHFDSKQFDITGLAYEEIIRRTFDKGDHQQFFTPPHIVDFIVSIAEPYIHGNVCDPASGTGGFLVSVARRGASYNSLTSIEIDERLSWVSGINLHLHGASKIRSLFLPDGGTLGGDARKLFSTFDTIITNPPFGSDFSDRDVLEQMGLGAGRSSRRRGILFLECCHSLLRENGTLAIIIDEGVLNLGHATDVRHFITSHFDIQAIISLPETAFMPYATVNASILILRKRVSTESNTRVFFAKAETVGRKPNGDEDIKYNRDGTSYLNSDLPKILAAWSEHLAGGTVPHSDQSYVADVSSNLHEEDNGHRIDFQYHHPSRWASRDLIAHCAYPLRKLSEICTERNVTVIPSKEMADSIIRYTGLAHIESETGIAEQAATPANSLKSAVKEYEPSDIVFAKMRPNLRKVAYMNFSEGGYVSPECSVYAVKHGKDGKPVIDPLILSVLLRSDFIYGQIMHLVAGIGRPRIGSKDLAQVLVPIPPLAVQDEIRRNYIASREKVTGMERQAQQLLDDAELLSTCAVEDLASAFSRGKE